MRNRIAGLTILSAVALGLTSCDAGPALYPVSGIVRFSDGQPVPNGLVEFSPERDGPAARGKIESDGTFILTTGTRPGAVTGTHRVIVMQVFLADGAASHVGTHRSSNQVHVRHAKYETSGLTVEVKPNPNGEVKITVDRATPAKKGW
jgi:hypothetical protein